MFVVIGTAAGMSRINCCRGEWLELLWGHDSATNPLFITTCTLGVHGFEVIMTLEEILKGQNWSLLWFKFIAKSLVNNILLPYFAEYYSYNFLFIQHLWLYTIFGKFCLSLFSWIVILVEKCWLLVIKSKFIYRSKAIIHVWYTMECILKYTNYLGKWYRYPFTAYCIHLVCNDTKMIVFCIQRQNQTSNPNRLHTILKAEVVCFNFIFGRSDMI